MRLLAQSFLRRAPIALLCFLPLHAQQRGPAIEIYGLTGGYYHGNVSIGSGWRPQIGAGVLVPLGRSWGAMADVTTSVAEANWGWDGPPPDASMPNFARERRLVLQPSFVRLWRRERFSIYFGGGAGFEHERQRNRFRPIASRDENGNPILAEEFVNTKTTRTDAALLLHGGVVANLSPRVVLRVGFSFLPRYIDEPASKSLLAGIGYRF